MFAALSVACGATVVVATVGGAWLGVIRGSDAPPLPFVLALTAAATTFLMKDFFVRFAYTMRDEAQALAFNASAAGALALTLGCVWLMGAKLGAAGALFAFAGSQLAGVVTGLWTTRLPLRTVRWPAVVHDAAESWAQGRWALGGVLVSWLQTQGYAYVTLVSLGTEGVGRANAARLLISPFLLLTTAINQVIMPRLAEHRARDPRSALRIAGRVTQACIVAALVYGAALLASIGTVVTAILGPKYSGMTALVAAWCVVLVCTLMRDGAANLLCAMKRFRTVMFRNAFSAFIALGATIALVRAWAGPGAVVGSAVGEVVLGAMLWARVRVVARDSAEPTRETRC